MIYPFKCPRCHTEFSVTLGEQVYSKLRDKMTCPLCGGNQKAKRTFYSDGVYVQFKGDGFTKSVKEEE